jgi:hypothetical protein
VTQPPARLSGLLELHLALEEAREVRSRRFHVTALLSLPMSIAALWPQLLSDEGRRAVLTFWAMSVCAAAWAVAVEWRLRARAMANT